MPEKVHKKIKMDKISWATKWATKKPENVSGLYACAHDFNMIVHSVNDLIKFQSFSVFIT